MFVFDQVAEATLGEAMQSVVHLKLDRAMELRRHWLEGFPEGGLFIPGSFDLTAGSAVSVHVTVSQPPTHVFLMGVVMWRRLPQRGAAAGVASLVPGIGVAFAVEHRHRVLFLDRLARGSASDARAAIRYPTQLAGEISLRPTEPSQPVRILDAGLRGARIVLRDQAYVQHDAPARLWVAAPRSGVNSFAPLGATVAWRHQETHATMLGLKLSLESPEERLHWAKVVTRAREAFEALPHVAVTA